MVFGNKDAVVGMAEHGSRIVSSLLGFAKLFGLNISRFALQLRVIAPGLRGGLFRFLALEKTMFEFTALAIQSATWRRHGVG